MHARVLLARELTAARYKMAEFEIVEWFKNKIKESKVTFVVYYRGFW